MKVRFEPSGVTSEARAGQTILQAAQAAGVDLESVCGGRGTCGKCTVLVTGEVVGLTELERRSLTAEELAQGMRLACQAVLQGDAQVVIPEASRRSRVSILAEGVQRSVSPDPWVRQVLLAVPPATLADQVCDADNLRRAWPGGAGDFPQPTLTALRQLPAALRQDDGWVTALAIEGRIVAVEPGRAERPLVGVAFDIGTTTVVGYLMDLRTGDQLAVASQLNPQTRYGDDVVSRIAHASLDGGLAALQGEIVASLNALIAATTSRVGLTPEDVLAVTVVGNTTMQHLLLGISPAALAQAPYVPAVEDALSLGSAELGLRTHPQGRVWVSPNIAGWVGGDTVGVILSTRIYAEKEIALAIDIGTNGEMALGSRERLITCSTAAGPAFEGAHLSCGMRAADGAIDRAHIAEDLHWHVIGDVAPRGLCGSGLVDLVAEMLRSGVLKPTGMLAEGEALRTAGKGLLSARVFQVGRQREFLLADAAQGAGGRPLRLTQRDVRELQLAKGAIRAGIEILLRELGVTHAAVHKVFMAGAFGNYISPQSALAIGLIPYFPNATIIPVGNAAGSGARLALISRAERERAAELVRRVEYLELSGRPDFQEVFAEAMLF